MTNEMTGATENTMEKHVLITGVFHVAFGILGILLGIVSFAAIFGGGVISGDPYAVEVTAFIASILISIAMLFSVPAIIGGFGLMAHKRWARILVLVVAAIEIFMLPFGTMLAVYTFWTLLSDRTDPLFRRVEE